MTEVTGLHGTFQHFASKAGTTTEKILLIGWMNAGAHQSSQAALHQTNAQALTAAQSDRLRKDEEARLRGSRILAILSPSQRHSIIRWPTSAAHGDGGTRTSSPETSKKKKKTLEKKLIHFTLGPEDISRHPSTFLLSRTGESESEIGARTRISRWVQPFRLTLIFRAMAPRC